MGMSKIHRENNYYKVFDFGYLVRYYGETTQIKMKERGKRQMVIK